MKIRTGFVSNSSSSSFVVFFPREPKNVDDVKDMLFKDEIEYLNPYHDEHNSYGWSADKVSKTVWKDICDQEKNNIEKAKRLFSSGYIEEPGAPSYDDFNHIKDWRKLSDAYSDACDRYAEKKIKEFLKNISVEPVFYCFRYSDNDGEYFSALEHGNLFHRLKHVRISNH
jgi:hypothetical protein